MCRFGLTTFICRPTTNITNAIADYGQFENPSYLAPGDCYEQSATVTLPIGVGGALLFHRQDRLHGPC